jgi:hypothetical protein
MPTIFLSSYFRFFIKEKKEGVVPCLKFIICMKCWRIIADQCIVVLCRIDLVLCDFGKAYWTCEAHAGI